MAFTITLYTNRSEMKKLDKTLELIDSVSGTLKDETSIINPVVIVRYPLESLNSCNYVVIPAFKRSYFVTDIVSPSVGLVELSCHVDVLSSFADDIRSNQAIIYRQENLWNLYLDDGSFKVYQNAMVLTKAFPSGFPGAGFVLSVAGAPDV